ncbi:NAD(P)-dependent oxidoreductase [Undibacterium sp. 5I1]|uniref:NAD(P)-dependent oxidoreductase n=1 Tax=unclassified Undibacterium TaxID=2630295 RepID=UPI002AB45FA2|nr:MULTISPECIES: NAD(P)-dependent oxidoreductase [unclassified Undibacterium]MDY7540268.1 NAD(P)-dependent oxidoreductase [Undibacterium sp. 5I1]MEB0232561.1 NAD(P)-dependent oxidoreductase [Undibacterium sp. 10I3]MEB0259401.1 NAD(P)-dependent oxidoreductase [Undibacterium sp. 5I1]
MTKPRIAFLGIGLMGKPMATRLIQAEYPLTVWNRTSSKCSALGALGADIAETPLAAINGCHKANIVISMLERGNIVADMIQQTLPALCGDEIWIDMSSTQQAEAQQFDQVLRDKKLGFIDAPVSGGVIGAKAGSLAIMAGANEADYARVRAILSVMGKPTRVGPPGTGQLAKLCNQLIVGGTISIVAEALLLAQAGGADPAAVRNALRGGFAESRILEVHGQRMLERNFLPGGQVKSQAKDMENIRKAAQLAELELPVTELIAEIYRSILGSLPGADHSAALLALEQKNPGKRLGTKEDIFPV